MSRSNLILIACFFVCAMIMVNSIEIAKKEEVSLIKLMQTILNDQKFLALDNFERYKKLNDMIMLLKHMKDRPFF